LHIELEWCVERSLARTKDFEENPPEVDEEGVPSATLAPVDKDVQSLLQRGQPLPARVLLELVNRELAQDVAVTKGFVLDLPLVQAATSSRVAAAGDNA
jgi:hypothetical protein